MQKQKSKVETLKHFKIEIILEEKRNRKFKFQGKPTILKA